MGTKGIIGENNGVFIKIMEKRQTARIMTRERPKAREGENDRRGDERNFYKKP